MFPFYCFRFSYDRSHAVVLPPLVYGVTLFHLLKIYFLFIYAERNDFVLYRGTSNEKKVLIVNLTFSVK